MSDYLFTSQFESIFSLQIKGHDILWEWEKKKETIPAQKTKGSTP